MALNGNVDPDALGKYAALALEEVADKCTVLALGPFKAIKSVMMADERE